MFIRSENLSAQAETEGYCLIPFDRICEALGIEHMIPRTLLPAGRNVGNRSVAQENRLIIESDSI